MLYLSIEDILRLHHSIIDDFGGSHGLRDEKQLLSVVESPKLEVFEQEQYPSVFDRAAVYARNIIADHPFIDGNKRSGITCAGVFLLLNGQSLISVPKDLEDFAVKIAVDHLSVETISDWLKQNSKI